VEGIKVMVCVDKEGRVLGGGRMNLAQSVERNKGHPQKARASYRQPVSHQWQCLERLKGHQGRRKLDSGKERRLLVDVIRGHQHEEAGGRLPRSRVPCLYDWFGKQTNFQVGSREKIREDGSYRLSPDHSRLVAPQVWFKVL
jgi:hypothetical protein